MRPLGEQIEEIRQGGVKIVIRKAKNFILPKLLVLLLFPGAIATGVMLRLLQPWVHFRFGYFTQERIGHFAIDVGLALAESELQSTNSSSDWYYLSSVTCNMQWTKMAKRNFRPPFWTFFFLSIN